MRHHLFLLLFAVSCGGNIKKEPYRPTVVDTKPLTLLTKETIEDTIAGVAVTIVANLNDSVTTTALLVLPGWDFERHRWLNETTVREEAKKHHYCLILPEMKRSIYATHYYQETTGAARKEKTGQWLTDTFIPAIQLKYNLLMPSSRNFVLGLSTGGRGAVYCAWKLPSLFMAAATLSGDFDQTMMPNDFLMTSVYGKYNSHQERWNKDDNLMYASESIRQPLYIGHGDSDKVVPFNQSKVFYAKVKDTNQKTKQHFVLKAGHNFKFWSSEVAPIFEFFDNL